MKIHIEYATTFTYAQLVRKSVGVPRWCPRDEDGQRLLSFQLALDPPTGSAKTIQCYSAPPHQRLVITATAVVETSATPLIAAPALTPMERYSCILPLGQPSWSATQPPTMTDDYERANAAPTGTHSGRSKQVGC